VRIEQLYPFPTEEYEAALRRYPQAARSSGARKSRRTRAPGTRSATGWSDRRPKDRHTLLYAGRGPAAAPATGIAKIHEAEQANLSTRRCVPRSVNPR
jgi:2-oxoglutarate dehydrogenase E1 component